MCYAIEGPLFAAASESVALLNLGFAPENIKSLLPGQAITITNGQLEVQRFASSPRQAHCFFEWIYFANVASTMDGRSVYLARKALGEELARLETVPIDEDTIVVPVPDTSKAAADAMAYKLRVPSVEGLIRNRYSGRTFIEGGGSRKRRPQTKYTPLREVLEGKRVLLVEDSIVRSTTMRVLTRTDPQAGAGQRNPRPRRLPADRLALLLRHRHVDDQELFAPAFLHGGPMTPEIEAEMAEDLGADSLRYLPVESIARAIRLDADQLCRACITGEYPTPCGARLAERAAANYVNGVKGRTYEVSGKG